MPLEHHVHAAGGAQVHMDGLQLLDAGSGNQHLHRQEAAVEIGPEAPPSSALVREVLA